MKISISRTQGSALVIALVLCGIVGILLGSFYLLSSHHYRMIKRAEAWNRAIPVLEAGIEEAMSQLTANPEQRDREGWKAAGGWYTKTRQLSDDSYYTVSISTNSPPLVLSKGFVKSPLETDKYISRTVRVTTTNRALFTYGIITKENIDMKGNNLTVNSWDSTDPDYSKNGRYDNKKTKAGGDVATRSGLVDSFNVGNAKIHGRVATGPGGTIAIGSQGVVGSSQWHEDGKKGIEPGWSSDDMNFDFPEITGVPTGGLTPLGTKIGKTTFQYVLNGGDYRVSDVSGSLFVTADSTLVVNAKFNMGGSDFIYIAPGASLKIYCYANDAKFGGGGVANTSEQPIDFQFYGMPSNKKITFSGGSEFIGVIYAPNAELNMGGGGSSTINFAGASATKTLKMNGHFNAHYDESLARKLMSGYVMTSWDEE